MSSPAWFAAYERALNEGLSEEDAIAAAKQGQRQHAERAADRADDLRNERRERQ